jgi:hypothetical protein
VHESAIWGSKRFQKLPTDSFPINPQNSAANRVSSVNKTVNNFSTVHAIFVQVSSIGAAWQKKFKNINESTKISFCGQFFGTKRPQWGFQAKKPC